MFMRMTGRSRAWSCRVGLVVAAVAAQRESSSARGMAAQVAETFEVASIRPVEEPRFRRALTSTFPGGRFEAANASVHDLIWYAYGLQRPQAIEGGPSWVSTDRFDVTAKAEHDPGPSAPGAIGPMQRMVQRLLAERFDLGIHVESRILGGRALVLARSDGRLGLQLHPSTLDCAAEDAAWMTKILAGENPQALEEGVRTCSIISTNGHMQAAGHTMSQFARALSLRTRETIVDQTGLTGPFVIDMTAAPSIVPPQVRAEMLARGHQFEQPTLDDALREQLGLKLDRARVEAHVIVIDRVERPTAN